MWKSWFLSTSLADLGLPAMFIFMVTFVFAAWRVLRTDTATIQSAAALPLDDSGERTTIAPASTPSTMTSPASSAFAPSAS